MYIINAVTKSGKVLQKFATADTGIKARQKVKKFEEEQWYEYGNEIYPSNAINFFFIVKQ